MANAYDFLMIESIFMIESNKRIRKRDKGCVSNHRQLHFEWATWSLATFVCLHRSLHSLAPQRSALLRYAHFAMLALLCSLRYARFASLHSLCFATLTSLAHSIHGLAHSLRSLPRGTFEIHEYVFTLWSRFMGTSEILVISRNTPRVLNRKVRQLEMSWYMSPGPNLVILLSVHAWHAPHNFSVPDREWACPVFKLTFPFTLDSIIQWYKYML